MNDLKSILEQTFGKVLHLAEEVPGVYFFGAIGEGRRFADEYYLVEQKSGALSSQAKAYGKPLNGHPDLLSYSCGIERSGYQIVRYEVAMYRHKTGNTPKTLEELRSTAIYGAESHPEYFGEFPAPIETPRGRTLRSKRIWNGVWCLETDQGERMVAVCYPIWDGDISQDAQAFGEQIQSDQAQGIDNTYGYLFFPWEASCIPLFELMSGNPKNKSSEMVNFTALKNMIWRKYPQYASVHNARVQARRQALSQHGADAAHPPTDRIADSPETRLDFLQF